MKTNTGYRDDRDLFLLATHYLSPPFMAEIDDISTLALALKHASASKMIPLVSKI